MILYNDYLKSKYGCKVYRIALDAGFTCPGRCIYCNHNGSRAVYVDSGDTIKEQIKKRMAYLKEANKAKKFIAYFQAFTNTNAPVGKLKKAYDEVSGFDDIVGISIGTRPDSVDREKIQLIASYKKSYEVWIEYGLQSAHDKTLQLINRGHTYDDFLKAYGLAKEYGLLVSAHVILGLPGEKKEDMIETAKKLSALKVDGIKIHLLHVLRGSELENMYYQGKVRLLEQKEYIELACDFLRNLSPGIIIQRLTGEGRREDHIAPLWALDKIDTINKIRSSFRP
ncbi:MAG: TIGR01212 family radical SAM protein [Candidatus Omnitrophota bacterium]